MPDTKLITCPHCQHEIPLDDVLTHQIEEKYKKEFETELQQEKVKLWKVAQEKALEKVKTEQDQELKLLREEIDEKTKKLEAAQKLELELRNERRKLEDAKKEFELQIQRKLDEERLKISEETAKKIAEEHRFKEAEIEKKLKDALRANEDLRRKLEQGSQQAQGEVVELELEQLLRSEFPFDEITEVSKGIHGADLLQKVRDKAGRVAGIITWESKRTKSWSDGWVTKLKDDQRSAKADIAVIVSHVLPKDMKYFGYRDGIHVCDYQSFIGLARLLRLMLLQLASTKSANIGKKEKMEILWNYLTGIEFRQRMEAILESFTTMKNDLDHEKRAMTKIWAKREKQIQRVLDNTIGLRGDLEGVMGNALPQMKQLELPTGEEELEELADETPF